MQVTSSLPSDLFCLESDDEAPGFQQFSNNFLVCHTQANADLL